jgi:hypothetical protein
VAEDPDLPGVPAAEAFEDLNRGGLAGAVGAQEGKDLALGDLQVNASNRLEPSVGLVQPADFNRWIGRLSSPARSKGEFSVYLRTAVLPGITGATKFSKR